MTLNMLVLVFPATTTYTNPTNKPTKNVVYQTAWLTNKTRLATSLFWINISIKYAKMDLIKLDGS